MSTNAPTPTYEFSIEGFREFLKGKRGIYDYSNGRTCPSARFHAACGKEYSAVLLLRAELRNTVGHQLEVLACDTPHTYAALSKRTDALLKEQRK